MIHIVCIYHILESNHTHQNVYRWIHAGNEASIVLSVDRGESDEQIIDTAKPQINHVALT